MASNSRLWTQVETKHRVHTSYHFRNRDEKTGAFTHYAAVVLTDGRLAIGRATNNHRDQYIRKIGYQIATGRALKQASVGYFPLTLVEPALDSNRDLFHQVRGTLLGPVADELCFATFSRGPQGALAMQFRVAHKGHFDPGLAIIPQGANFDDVVQEIHRVDRDGQMIHLSGGLPGALHKIAHHIADRVLEGRNSIVMPEQKN